MRAREITNLDGVANGNVKGRLGRLLDADAGLRAALHTARPRSIHRRRHPRASGAVQAVIVVDKMRIERPSRLLLLRRHRRPNHHLLLLRRHRRAVGRGIEARPGAQRAQRIVDGLELRRLGHDAAGGAGRARR